MSDETDGRDRAVQPLLERGKRGFHFYFAVAAALVMVALSALAARWYAGDGDTKGVLLSLGGVLMFGSLAFVYASLELSVSPRSIRYRWWRFGTPKAVAFADVSAIEIAGTLGPGMHSLRLTLRAGGSLGVHTAVFANRRQLNRAIVEGVREANPEAAIDPEVLALVLGPARPSLR